MSIDKQFSSSEPITKQQLFVSPIDIINKQNPSFKLQSQQNINNILLSSNTSNNFTQLIIDNANSDLTSHSKTKIILKSQQPTNKFKNYRTSICPYGMQCRKRLTCNYAHNQKQIRKPYKNRKNPCIRYQKGLCGLGATCPDYHGNIDLKKKNYKYKSLPCKQWQQKGKCSKGDLCIYLHGQGQEQGNQIDAQSNDVIVQNEAIHNDQNNQIVNQDITIKQQEYNQLLPTNQKNPTLKIGQIFKTSNKKTILAKQVIEQPIKQETQVKQIQNKVEEDENFNIQFNF